MNYIFDFDGTLADSKQCSIFSTQNAFETCGLNIPSQRQMNIFMGIPIEQSFPLMTDCELPVDKLTKLLEIFRSYYKQLEQNTLTVFDGIPAVLAYLKSGDNRLSCWL